MTLTPMKLISALVSLPEDSTLVKSGNSTGNIAILNANGGYIGFIDLTTGEVDVWDTEMEPPL